MITFQERFILAFNREQARRLENGEPRLTKTMVWKAAKATSGAFTQWFDGTTGMKLDTCFLVSKILRVNPHWLFDGTGDMRLSPSSDTKKTAGIAEYNGHIPEESAMIYSLPKTIDASDAYIIRQYAAGGSMGHGLAMPDQPGVIENWSVSREWLQKNVRNHTGVQNLCIVTGFGPSMQPMFNPGDPLLVDTGVSSVIADGVYFFRVGSEAFIKQLQKIPTADGLKYVAKSKNKDFDPFEITEGMDFEVLGRVVRVWCGTDF